MTPDTTSPPSTVFRAAADLRLLTWPALDASGVGAGARIHATDISTGPVPGHFFSDRAARPCGRLALAARLRPGGVR
jgi:hypothetical protein